MRQIDPSPVKEASFTCSLVKIEYKKAARSLRMFVPSTAHIVYACSPLCLSRGQLWNVDKGL